MARPRLDWEGNKGTLFRLYVEEKLPLSEVMDIMKKKHNFVATYVSFPLCRGRGQH
jgi:hypothetical protein